ncbi:MAG: hypothetical protein AAGI30_02860 [Planctomycetota bacterium]
MTTALTELKYTDITFTDDGYFSATSPEGVPVVLLARPNHHGLGWYGFVMRPPFGTPYGEVPPEYEATFQDLHASMNHLLLNTPGTRLTYSNRVRMLNTRLNAARAASIGGMRHHHGAPAMPTTPGY